MAQFTVPKLHYNNLHFYGKTDIFNAWKNERRQWKKSAFFQFMPDCRKRKAPTEVTIWKDPPPSPPPPPPETEMRSAGCTSDGPQESPDLKSTFKNQWRWKTPQLSPQPPAETQAVLWH